MRGGRALWVAEAVVNVVLFGGLLLLAIFGVAGLVGGLGDVTLPTQAEVSLADPDRGVARWVDTTATIEDPTVVETLLGLVVTLGQIPVVIVAVWLLRRVLESVRRGEPFGAASVRRLRQIGAVLIAGGLVVEVVVTQVRQELWDHLPRTVQFAWHPPNDAQAFPARVEPFEWPVTILLAGLVALVLAEVFAYGARLREDVEATI